MAKFEFKMAASDDHRLDLTYHKMFPVCCLSIDIRQNLESFRAFKIYFMVDLAFKLWSGQPDSRSNHLYFNSSYESPPYACVRNIFCRSSIKKNGGCVWSICNYYLRV